MAAINSKISELNKIALIVLAKMFSNWRQPNWFAKNKANRLAPICIPRDIRVCGRY